ncbi:MAG: FG-GAP repeat protein, partial [Deltaproteobacteria bacterium]|nr:FG-GAP repeat protein [Deltaproteobacteria bacterium]
PGVDTPGTDPAGVAYVIFGNQSMPSSFDLLSTSADVTIVGEQRKWDYNLGIAIASGDVDGDSVKDIILGFRGASSSAGKVYLILGRPTLGGIIYLSSSADQKIYGAGAKSYLGDRLASGNINGDAYDDVIIGAPGADNGAGRVYVLFGTPSFLAHVDLNTTPADMTIHGDNAQDYFGSSLASGDLNGDGIDDLAAGAWAADSAKKSASGKVYIFYGSSSFTTPLTIDLDTAGADVTLDGPSIGGFLGYALATGDVNGDGMTDLLIGAYGTNIMAGRVYVIYGKVPLGSTFDIEISGANAYDKSGAALASGDLNGDNVDDIIWGALEADPGSRNEAGNTYVILGTTPAGAAGASAEDRRTDTNITIEDTGTGSSGRIGCFIDAAANGSCAHPDAQLAGALKDIHWSVLIGLLAVVTVLGSLLLTSGRPLTGIGNWKRKRQVMIERITRFSVLVFLLAAAALMVSAQTAEAVPQEHHGGSEGCRRCHMTHGRRAEVQPGQFNLYSIKDVITTPNSGDADVEFLNTSGTKSYADGGAPFDGVCEVCHTQTKYFKNDTWDDPTACDSVPHKSRYAEQDCTTCHDHEDAFVHGGGASCNGCHGVGSGPGTATSHETHTQDTIEEKGLGILLTFCGDCHDFNAYPCFSDSQNLTNTTVCNTCHSPLGGFDGVDNGTYGAKTLWSTGSVNTAKWCVGCHDSVPSVITGSRTAGDIGGDNSSYGYYYGEYGYPGAHGNQGYGVKRIGVSAGKGECAHCHNHDLDEDGQDDDSHGQLFADMNPSSQDNNFCFQCHKGTGSVQDNGINNFTYAKTFGGGPGTDFDNIYDAFNPATGATPSSHNLADVLTHAVGRGIGFTSNTNACLVCHDVHAAQRNSQVVTTTEGGVLTAIRRPSENGGGESLPTNLWGDSDGRFGNNETMLSYTAKYQAPYYKSGGGNFEPANDATFNGSNVPNYKNSCTDNCHSRTDVYSTGHSRNLLKTDWGVEQHGKGHSGGTLGASIAPYTDPAFNYVLSCLDCHEPHGSENEFLLRSTINGVDVSVPGPGRYWHVCSACHTFNQHFAPFDDTC